MEIRPPSADRPVLVSEGGVALRGDLGQPDGATGLVVFSHGSGSSRGSPRNRFVARVLREAGLGTLLFDLLTAEEERMDAHTAHLRFDIELLAGRLTSTLEWVARMPETQRFTVGCFGASTGAAAALVAAARRPAIVHSVVSRGGRPDLAGDALPLVRAPTLLIVGGNDHLVQGVNREAFARLAMADKRLVTVPGATHLFEEPGALEQVARLAADWFTRTLVPAGVESRREGDGA
jgi:dienelactone hydrolase